jgi:hypothetical protein
MTDEPPESQLPWPDDQQQPSLRRHASDYDGFYAPGQPQSEPGYGQQPQHFAAPPPHNSGPPAARAQHQVPQHGSQQADPGDAVTQQLYQRSQADDFGAAQPWTQPGYYQPPYQLMGPLFESGSNYGEFRSSETMNRWSPSKARRRKILLVAAYAAALVVVAVVAGILVSWPTKPAASKNNAAAAVPSASAATATVPPTTPASSPAAPDHAGVLSWWTSYGLPASLQFSKTMAQMSADARSAETTDDLSAVEADLTTAQGEIQAAQADPPIPDVALEQLWRTALADWGSAVSDTLNGVENNLDLSEMKQANAELLDGNTAFNVLIRDVNSLIP